MRVALHSLTRDGAESGYDQTHAVIPAALAARFAELGIHDWTIWRSGRHLFHLVECDDFLAAMAALDGDPVNAEWQATIGPFVDHFEVNGVGEGDAGLPVPLVWRLRTQVEGVAGDA
ncbi:L-rhamnose mutarotase [Herbiconiux ginsengi]|uniref:L-rhamnose mutarotase n=1 Tax=Herbiconiux ginsengi TaxID=381665 RepID=A0A1H3N8I9_9MICO|nr:L-rhamnose mutarotase [Herbiconiux ginsengi]SDY84795.1 L-rhamnose mutarotase [Herbiconiux ginsengi]